MICVLMAGALMASQASHLPPLEFKPVIESGHREFIKQVNERTEYIVKHNVKLNQYDRTVNVIINGEIGLLMDDKLFVRKDDLMC